MKKQKPQKKATVQAHKNEPAFTLSPQMFALIITIVYTALTIIGLFNHELWRDEYQAWMIADESSSFAALLHNYRQEGHPILWHFLLWIASGIYSNPVSMQVIHLVFAGTAIYLFNRYAPFNNILKIFFTFGYFPFFEYALISRSYILGILFATLFCLLYKEVKKNMLWIGITLLLLANTSIFGLTMAVSFFAFMIIDLFIIKSRDDIKITYTPFIIATFIFFIGCYVSVLQMIPPKDSNFSIIYPDGFELRRLQVTVASMFGAWVPIPPFTDDAGKTIVEFWNKSYFWKFPIYEDPAMGTWFVVTIIAFVFFMLNFIDRPAALLLYVGGSLSILFALYVTLRPYQRFMGYLFILLVHVFWLSHYVKKIQIKHHLIKYLLGYQKLIRYSFSVMLAIAMFCGIYAWSMDYRYPFSNIQKTAAFLKKEKLDTNFILGGVDYVMSPLTNIIQKPIFYPESDTLGTFIVWDKKRAAAYPFDQILKKAQDLVRQGHTKYIMILSLGLENSQTKEKVKEGYLSADIRVRLIEKFDKRCISEDEKYYIYWVEKVVPNTLAPQ